MWPARDPDERAAISPRCGPASELAPRGRKGSSIILKEPEPVKTERLALTATQVFEPLGVREQQWRKVRHQLRKQPGIVCIVDRAHQRRRCQEGVAASIPLRGEGPNPEP